MRPPILWISVAFGAGLWTGLDAFQVRGAWYVVAPVLVGAAALHRRAPLGAALGIMAAAGGLWGGGGGGGGGGRRAGGGGGGGGGGGRRGGGGGGGGGGGAGGGGARGGG